MRVTIRDIARKTGLSPSTVSLVLNNKCERISQKTRDLVLKVAAEMNYHPNQMAVGLITRRTKTLGLIIPDITNTFFAEIAKGAEEACQKSGYSLMLCNTNDNPQKDADYINVLASRGVDGILFTMSVSSQVSKDTQCFRILQQVEKPFVLVDRTVEAPEGGSAAPSVLVDNELGGYLATRHLLELGHRRIGFISGPMGELSSQKRLFGYIRALQEYGITFDPMLMKVGDYHTSTGYQLAKALLEQHVTGIFACNDMMAYGVFQQADQQGIQIPRQLSVVGFDDLQFSQLMRVPLTTMKQPAYDIGAGAVQKLIQMLDHPDQPQDNLIFKPELVVRSSTGPAPKEST
ncbi:MULTISPECIES: LacI family DNA-binding transcriptional regulator [Caproicibacterium]|nr:LacI family DNA-binding transcriptional regulator [Caproicibacterium lactatifermentans]MDD4807263.1 LacI family DNA-binding transcriptional regulator [Oscillospiraceae bacterium]